MKPLLNILSDAKCLSGAAIVSGMLLLASCGGGSPPDPILGDGSAVLEDTAPLSDGSTALKETTPSSGMSTVHADTISPTIISTAPLPYATAVAINSSAIVAINSNVSAIFSEAMDPLTIISGNFSLACPTSMIVSGTVIYTKSSQTMSFTPAENLPINTRCSASISSGVTDVAGNALVDTYSWDFQTGDATATNVSQSL